MGLGSERWEMWDYYKEDPYKLSYQLVSSSDISEGAKSKYPSVGDTITGVLA